MNPQHCAPAPKLKYDLVVIGSGPGGQRAAVQAAKLKKSVLVVERDDIGGACLHTGTIPSKTLREAALRQEAWGLSTFSKVMDHKREVIRAEADVIGEQLKRNSIDYVQGLASFASEHAVFIKTVLGTYLVEAAFVVIATGARPYRPRHVPFNDHTVFDSETILNLTKLPKRLAVVGAGVIGCEYASIFAKMGVDVTVVDQRSTLLPAVDQEIVTTLQQHFIKNRIDLYLSCPSVGISLQKNIAGEESVALTFHDKCISFEVLLYCVGREGNVDHLNLATVNIQPDSRSLIEVNEHYQTVVPHIYAVGDVIGHPALAASSAEQGRLAANHAFGFEAGRFPESFPYGIYTIPEISSVGAHEEELERKKIPFVVGRALYRELARGKILQDDDGFLKLLVDKKTRRILGIHIIGTGATELVHIGQIAMALGATVDLFVNNVFNYPTLAEAYKVAAYHAFNQLRTV